MDEVLRPDSACRVQKWLESATDSERKTLLNVLETLAVASEDIIQSPPQLILPPANWHQPTTPHHYRLIKCAGSTHVRPEIICNVFFKWE